MLLFILAPLGLALVLGVTYQRYGRARDIRNHPALGRMVEAGGRRLHIMTSGSGGPAVILEAGIGATSLSWGRIEPEVARFTSVCGYDRIGLGWSEGAPDKLTLDRSLRDLHALLAAARVPGPYVLAGHSYGGLLARAYASRYPDEVAGLVLIDPVSVNEWAAPAEERLRALRRGVELARRGALLARLGVVRLAVSMLVSGGSRAPRWIARASSTQGESVAGRVVGEVRKLPRAYWPMIQAHWCDPKCFRSMAAHLECLPASAAALAAQERLPDVPLVILSAANATPGELAERDALAKTVSAGRHSVAAKSGHWIQLDEPELVIEAVREVVERVRVDAAARRA